MAAAQAGDLSFLSTAQRPKQQGLSVMLTNALRSNSPLRFQRNILPTKRPQAVIRPIGGSAGVSGRAALGANKVGLRKAPVAAPHPLVAITPGDSFRRRMVRSTGMTAEIVQETGGERIEYRFKAPVHLLILFERGVRREGETAIAGLPGSSLRDLARKFVFVPAGHEYRDWREPSARRSCRMAATHRHRLYRGSPGRSDIARGPCRARRPEHLPFLPGLQAVFRYTAASLSREPAHRSRQGAARQAGSVSDQDRLNGRLQRDEFLQRRLSQGDRAHADRLSPGSG